MEWWTQPWPEKSQKMVTDVWVVLCIHDSLKATQTNKLHSHNQMRNSSLFSLTRRAWSLSLVQRGVSDVHSVLWALGCPFTPPHADWRPAKASPPIHRAGEMLAGNDGQTAGWGPKSGRTILGFAHLFRYIPLLVSRCRSAQQLCQKFTPPWGSSVIPKEKEVTCTAIFTTQSAAEAGELANTNKCHHVWFLFLFKSVFSVKLSHCP